MDVLKHFEEVINMFVPGFYIGKKWSCYNPQKLENLESKVIENIIVGYALSKPWYVRLFKRKKLHYECAVLEAACEYWMNPVYLYGILFTAFDNNKERQSFMNNVVDISEHNLGIFKEAFVWEMYLTMAINGFIDPYILMKYQNLRW